MRWPLHKSPASWFGIFHRALGVILLASFWPLAVGDRWLFGTHSLFDQALFRLHPHAFGHSVYDLIDALSNITSLPTNGALTVLIGLYMACCIALIGGRAVRLAALGLLLLHHAFFVAVPLYSYGFDYLSLSALAYCAVYTKRWAAPILRLLQLHLCIVYFFGGLNKALGPSWYDGEALWKASQQPIGTPLVTVDYLRSIPWLWMVGGWGIVVLELAYPLLIWWRAGRRFALATIILMHVGIALLMGLYGFSALMILLNLVAFYYPYLPLTPDPASTDPIQANGSSCSLVQNMGNQPTNRPSSSLTGSLPNRPP